LLENVQPLLAGHAKAMVVVGSRLEAVRWQLAMQKYIQSRGYRLSALVAFSGEVNDKPSGEDPFTENSQVLNRALPLGEGDSPTLKPLTDTGSGSVQEKEKARLGEIIAKVNDLFGADTTEGDKLVYVNDVIKGKLMESDTLRQQAVSNSKEQFANSPDLNHELINAIMDASSALSSLSKQALESEHIRSGLKEVLLGPAQLYEALRARDLAGHPGE
jgi:hypothetical protein